MTLTRGDRLSPTLRAEVLRAFVYRHTHENARQTYGGQCPACEQVKPFPYVCGQALPDGPHSYTRAQWHAYHVPLTDDATWLREHAFYVTRRGTLDARRTHAQPAYMIETEATP